MIDERTLKWSPKLVQDPVQNELLRLIASKKARRTKRSAAAEATGGDNVVDLFAALRKSLGTSGGSSKPGSPTGGAPARGGGRTARATEAPKSRARSKDKGGAKAKGGAKTKGGAKATSPAKGKKS